MNEKTLNTLSSSPLNKKKSSIIDKLEKDCFKCNQIIKVKFVNAKGSFSQKNNWGYWTEKEEDKEKYICSKCLRKWYSQNYLDFRRQVTNLKKVRTFRSYLGINII
jgi:hypothetical protein